MGVCFSSGHKAVPKNVDHPYNARHGAPPAPESSTTVSTRSANALTVDPVPPVNVLPASEAPTPAPTPVKPRVDAYSWVDHTSEAAPVIADTHAQVAATQAKAAAAASAEASAAAAAASLAIAAMEAFVIDTPV